MPIIIMESNIYQKSINSIGTFIGFRLFS